MARFAGVCEGMIHFLMLALIALTCLEAVLFAVCPPPSKLVPFAFVAILPLVDSSILNFFPRFPTFTGIIFHPNFLQEF